MKKTNKLLSMMLMMVLSLSTTLSSVTPVKADVHDDVAPVFTSVSVNSTDLNVGDELVVYCDIVEEGTGIKEMYVNGFANECISFEGCEPGSLSGRYIARYTVPDTINSGKYLLSIHCQDYYNSSSTLTSDFDNIWLNVTNPNYIDLTGPQVISSEPEDGTDVTAGDTKNIIVNIPDNDLDHININISDLDGNNYSCESGTVDISEDGIYTVPFNITSDMKNGTYYVLTTNAYDKLDNWTYHVNRSETSFNIVGCTEEVKTYISFDNVVVPETPVVLPGVAKVHIEGSSNLNSDKITYKISFANKLYDRTVDLIDGKFSDDVELTIDSSFDTEEILISLYADGFYSILYNGKNDSMYYPVKVVSGAGNITNNISINNPKFVEHIEAMNEGETILVNCNSTIANEEIFEAIKGKNKTLLFDLDGIEWIVNGLNIDNPKDIDISTMIQNVDLTQYGYDSDTNGIALVFQPNGILPGKVQIRIKEDYIKNKFNLNSSLYLGFIKDSADSDDELFSVSGNSVSENDIDEYETKLIKIEDAEVQYDGSYVSLFLTHNSSYILSDKLPSNNVVADNEEEEKKEDTTKKEDEAVNNNHDSNTTVNESDNKQQQNTETSTTPVVKKKIKVNSAKLSKVSIKKSKMTVKIKKASKVTGYQIKYSTRKNMKSAKIKTTKKLTNTIKVKKNKKYYVQVRSYKIVNGKKYYSSWSKVKAVK